MLPDVIDANELETGLRREGFLCAFLVFFNKISTGLALGISGYVLASAGFIEGEDPSIEQPEEVDVAIRILVGVVPGLYSLTSPSSLLYMSSTFFFF